MLNSKQLLTISLCFALLLTGATYVFLNYVGDGSMAISESDQIIYLQYARNMAQGNPLVFSPNDSPSSGSTTYLYIVLLSVFFRLGLEGNGILIASFFLNALFYLGSLVMVWSIAKKLVPKALWLVMALSTLSGHMISAILGQTDIGLFTFLALALYCSLQYQRFRWALLLTALCAATRPEGFVFSIAFFLCGLIGLIYQRVAPEEGQKRTPFWFLAYALAGGTVFFITLLLNRFYTGEFQFMSVQGKGFFNVYSLSGAIQHTTGEAMGIIKGVLLGLQENKRQYFFLPVLSGFLAVSGILLKRRENRHEGLCELWFGLAALGAVALISSSQFAGLSNDRYLGWIMPVWVIYIALGLWILSTRLKAPSFTPICASLLIGFQFISITHIASATYRLAILMEHKKDFTHELERTFPPSTRFGSIVGNSINYFAPSHTIYNLWGITSPDFSFDGDTQSAQRIISILKHKTHLRFDYWITSASFLESNPWMEALMGEQVMYNKDTALFSKTAHSVRKARWDLLDGGELPVLTSEKDTYVLIDSLDIGYGVEEELHHYKLNLRLKDTVIPSLVTFDKLEGADHIESGRLVLGSESFIVHTVTPGKPLRMILRTGKKAEGAIRFNQQAAHINNLELISRPDLRIFCDGEEIPSPDLELDEEGFSELVIDIPATFITSPSPSVTVVGDHISYAYWFYQ